MRGLNAGAENSLDIGPADGARNSGPGSAGLVSDRYDMERQNHGSNIYDSAPDLVCWSVQDPSRKTACLCFIHALGA